MFRPLCLQGRCYISSVLIIARASVAGVLLAPVRFGSVVVGVLRESSSCAANWVLVHQMQVSRAGTSNYIPQILWDVITSPCPWYLLLAHKYSIDKRSALHGGREYKLKNTPSRWFEMFEQHSMIHVECFLLTRPFLCSTGAKRCLCVCSLPAWLGA